MGGATAVIPIVHIHVHILCRVESVQLKVYEDDYNHNIILSCGKDCKLKYWNIKRYSLSYNTTYTVNAITYVLWYNFTIQAVQLKLFKVSLEKVFHEKFLG